MSSGLIAFLVILAMAVGAIFLFRSMITHMRRVPPSFDPDDEETGAPQSSPSD